MIGGFRSQWGLGIFLLTTGSRPALGPNHPPLQWLSGALFLGAKRPGREADNLHLVLRSRMRGAIPPLPNTSSWRDAQLKHIDNFTFPFNSSFTFTFTCTLHIPLPSFLGSTAQLRPWPPPQNQAEFLGGFSTIFFYTG
jgi:hypothetical protein